MANMYYDFFKEGEFSRENAGKVFHNERNCERRCSYISQIYQAVLGSSKINETTKIYIQTRKTYAAVASYFNNLHREEIMQTKQAEEKGEKTLKPVHAKTANLVKADISYTNKRLNSLLGCGYPCNQQDNFFELILRNDNIDEGLWTEAEAALEKLKAACGERLIGKDDCWLNIPYGEFNKELDDEEFHNLLDIITPYFTVQKTIAQKKLNNMKKEVGYLNYVLHDGVELSEKDRERRDLILSLMDKEQTYSIQKNNSEPVEQDPYQKELLQLQEEEKIDKQKRQEIMSRIGYVYYMSRGTDLTEPLKQKIGIMEKEYEALNQIRNGRQKKIDGLQNLISKKNENAEKINL